MADKLNASPAKSKMCFMRVNFSCEQDTDFG